MSDVAPAEVEEFPDVEEAPDGQPLVAAFFAVAVVVIAVIFIPIPPLEGVFARVIAIGLGTLVAAVLWGVGYFVTIKHSSTGWKLGSFALIWLATVVTLDRVIAMSHAAMMRDIKVFEMIVRDPDGRPSLPEKSEQVGPISKMFVDFFKATSDDLNKTEGQIGNLDLEPMIYAYRVDMDPSVIENCERADKGKPLVRDYAKRQQKRAADMKAQAEAMWLPPVQKTALMEAVDRHGGMGGLAEQTEIQAKMFDEWRIRCTILQRKNWKAQGWMFMFTSASDLAEMREAAGRHEALRVDFQRNRERAMGKSGALHLGLRMP